MPATADSILNRPQRSSLLFAGLALLPGLIGLSGWIGDSFTLRSFFNSGATMKVDTALLITACAISLILLNTGKRLAAVWVLSIAAIFSFLILAEHIGHISLGIDEWWFQDKDFNQLHEPPGRTSAFAATSVVSICLISLLAIFRKYRTSQILAFFLFITLYAVLLGQLFGVTSFYRHGIYSGIALHTAVSLLLLSISISLYQSRHGWMQLFVLELNGRRGFSLLLVYLFSAAPLLVALFIYFINHGRFSPASGIIVLVVLSAFVSIPVAYLVLSRLSRAEKQLARTNQRLKVALDAARLGSYDLELATGQMQCSSQCLANFGLPAGSAFHFPDLLEAIVMKFRLQIQEQVAHAIATHTTYYSEYQAQWPDGTVHWIKASGSPQYDMDDHAVSLIGITQDITIEKEAEAKKNSFIGIVSHELKTPLTSIKGYVQLLKNRVEKEGDDFKMNALVKTETQVNKMTSMINSFLDVARLESGTLQLTLSCFSVNRLIEEVIEEYRFVYNNHIIHFSPCPEVTATADREKIEHLIANLLGNAVKYSHMGTTIEIGCEKGDRQVQVYVKDEGIGIRAEEIPRLFDRFFRVENHSNNNNISGFGIGLYLSAEIIQLHNGTIRVESEPGKGSTFYFTLPLIN